jgi:hypothetical protein
MKVGQAAVQVFEFLKRWQRKETLIFFSIKLESFHIYLTPPSFQHDVLVFTLNLVRSGHYSQSYAKSQILNTGLCAELKVEPHACLCLWSKGLPGCTIPIGENIKRDC